MLPNDEWDHQGKREDQVSFSELVVGVCVGLLLIAAIGWALLHFASLAP